MSKEHGPDVVLAGDSLIEYMQMFDFYNELFEPLNCLNLGVGGERTEQVCRRLKGGQLNKINPKVIVLLCGTNNINQSAQQVCEGVLEIVHVITEKQPKAQLIVVGIPPKGQTPNQYRQWAVDINSLVEDKVPQFPNCHFHRMDPSLFVKEDGTIHRSDMFDFLHFTGAGYMKWVPKLVEKIKELLSLQNT